MRNIGLFWSIIKRCQFEKIGIGFLIVFFIASGIIEMVEPDINSYGDALWYTFISTSTIGFGDIVQMKSSR